MVGGGGEKVGKLIIPLNSENRDPNVIPIKIPVSGGGQLV